MLVNFHLRPAADVRAWEPGHALHWLGLSDGWYWLEVGGVELFRYSPAMLSHWGVDDRAMPYLAYAEWFLADFWNYLLDDLPTFLTPVPADPGALLADDQRWQEWDRLATHEPEQGDLTSDPAAYQEVHDVATRWWHARQVDSAWLRHAPGIWLWRIAETMHVRWDCRLEEDGVPVWAATTGMHMMPVSTFLAEVSGFHTRFMQTMVERINVARSGWPRPDIRIDIDQRAGAGVAVSVPGRRVGRGSGRDGVGGCARGHQAPGPVSQECVKGRSCRLVPAQVAICRGRAERARWGGVGSAKRDHLT